MSRTFPPAFSPRELQRRHKKARRRLLLEALESRWLLTTIDLELTALLSPSASDNAAAVPTPIETVGAGTDYYVEVWARQTLGTQGINGGYVDIRFDPDAQATFVELNNGGIFDQLTSGSFTAPDLIDDLGGGTFDLGVGVADWARLGYVRMTADGTAPITYTLENGGLEFALVATSPNVPWSEVDLDSLTLNNVTTLDIAATDAVKNEGDVGNTAFTFTVTRSGGTTGAGTVDWSVAGLAPDAADVDDFGGAFPGNTLSFAAGETSKTITVNVSGDTTVEQDENFRVTLSNPTGGWQIATASADGVIQNDDTEVSVTVSPASVVENSFDNLEFTFARTGGTSNALTVDYDAVLSTASPGVDFSLVPNGTVTFNAGEATAVVTANPAGDTTIEPDEIVRLRVLDGAGYEVGSPSIASGTIIDDDGHRVSVAVDPASVAEDGATNLTYTFTRAGTTTVPLTVNFTTGGTASDDDDYAVSGTDVTYAPATDSGSVIIPVGSATATVTVDPTPNDVVEDDETVVLTVAPAAGYLVGTPDSATGTIENDDATLQVTDIEDKAEGDAGPNSFVATITRVGDTSGSVSVDYTVVPALPDPIDANDVGGSFPATATVTFAAGEATKIVTLNLDTGDLVVEPDEHFTLLLSNPTGGARTLPAADVGTLINDDTDLAIGPAQISLAEGNAGPTDFTFIVTRTGDTSGAASAEWAVTGVAPDAANGTDFVGNALPSGTVSFAAGEPSQSITVQVQGDLGVETDEDFRVTLSNPTDAQIAIATADGVIVNDDTSVAIFAADADKPEGDVGTTPFTFTVTRIGVTTGSTTVDWAVTGLVPDAADGADFAGGALPGGTATFAAGETSKTITVDVQGDTDPEADEGFRVTLSNATAGVQISSTTADGTIQNDDTTVFVAVNPASVLENSTDNLVYTFTRNGSFTDSLSVSFTTAGTSSDDDDYTVGGTGVSYTPASDSGTVTIPAGSASATVTVDPTADALPETDETVEITVIAASGYAVGSPNTATGTILDVDITAPQITMLAPADDTTAVAITTDLVMTFDEAVVKGSGNIIIKRSSDDSIVETIDVTDTKVSVSGAVVTVDPADLSPSTTYYVEVSAGAMQDAAGNNFGGISGNTTWNFTTVAVGGPIIIVGSHDLLPDTANQVVSIFVTGAASVTGINVRAQIGDGTGPLVEPVFDGIDFTGGIWDAHASTTTGGPVNGAEQFVQASEVFNNSGDDVVADGLVMQFLVDTTGISEGEFELRLEGTQIGANTEFILSGGAPLPIAITNGTLNIVPTTVLSRQFFYNNSFFDGNNPAPNANDDDAIASDKTALLPGGTANFTNYTSYSKGVNGIMFDIVGLASPGSVSDANFEFKVGNTQTPSSWSAGPSPLSVTVREDVPAQGVDRVVLIWADGAIQKQWLQVTIKNDPAIGLSIPDVSYFGNAVGESGNSTTNTFVDGSDFAGARDNPHNFLNRAQIDDSYDYNRDSFVDGSDLAIARDNNTNFLTALKLLDFSSGAQVNSALRAPSRDGDTRVPASGSSVSYRASARSGEPALSDTERASGAYRSYDWTTKRNAIKLLRLEMILNEIAADVACGEFADELGAQTCTGSR